jgi:DUF3102 family protein
MTTLAVANTSVTLPTADRLAALAARIRQAHADIDDAFRTAADRAIEAGNALLEAKRLVGHGGWLPWLEARVQLSVRQAQRYMKVARLAADGKYVPGDAFDLQRVAAASAPRPSKTDNNVTGIERVTAAPAGHNNAPTFRDNAGAVVRVGRIVTSFRRIGFAIRDKRCERSHLIVLYAVVEKLNERTGTTFVSRRAVSAQEGPRPSAELQRRDGTPCACGTAGIRA